MIQGYSGILAACSHARQAANWLASVPRNSLGDTKLRVHHFFPFPLHARVYLWEDFTVRVYVLALTITQSFGTDKILTRLCNSLVWSTEGFPLCSSIVGQSHRFLSFRNCRWTSVCIKKTLWLHSIFLLSLKWVCWCMLFAFMSKAEGCFILFVLAIYCWSPPQTKAVQYQFLYLQLNRCTSFWAGSLWRCVVTCVWNYSAVWICLAG